MYVFLQSPVDCFILYETFFYDITTSICPTNRFLLYKDRGMSYEPFPFVMSAVCLLNLFFCVTIVVSTIPVISVTNVVTVS